MDQIKKYIETHHQRFVDELFELLRFPSVSAKRERKDDCRKAAEYLHAQLAGLGFEVSMEETPGNPIVLATYHAGDNCQTVLIYGHYDVQPEEPVELWDSPPFEPTIRDGNVFARGASDDKGQVFAHIKAIESILKTEKKLPVNVIFLIEGEEEIASVHLEDFIQAHREKLRCDFVVISDSYQYGPDQPAICYGLRGICSMELRIEGAKSDLHSGSYGGAVPNPCQVVCELIAKLKNEDGRILIPGFYDDVQPLEEWEREAYHQLNWDDEKYRTELKLPGLHGEKEYSTLERIWARPTLEVNGIFGGYAGEGTKTIIPNWAGAKITMRLVSQQRAKRIAQLFKNFVTSITPPYVKLRIIEHAGGDPIVIPRSAGFMHQAIEAIEFGFGKPPVFIREGGSIPIVAVFRETLGVDTLLVGFGQPDDNAHAPNEKFSLRDFQRGVLTSAKFLMSNCV